MAVLRWLAANRVVPGRKRETEDVAPERRSHREGERGAGMTAGEVHGGYEHGRGRIGSNHQVGELGVSIA